MDSDRVAASLVILLAVGVDAVFSFRMARRDRPTLATAGPCTPLPAGCSIGRTAGGD